MAKTWEHMEGGVLLTTIEDDSHEDPRVALYCEHCWTTIPVRLGITYRCRCGRGYRLTVVEYEKGEPASDYENTTLYDQAEYERREARRQAEIKRDTEALMKQLIADRDMRPKTLITMEDLQRLRRG